MIARPSRSSVASALAEGLRTQGYEHVTVAMVREILDARLKGARGMHLPHGIIGMIAAQQFEPLEAEQPGVLAALRRGSA